MNYSPKGSNVIQHHTDRCPSAFVAGTSACIMVTLRDLQGVEIQLNLQWIGPISEKPPLHNFWGLSHVVALFSDVKIDSEPKR